MITNLYTEAQSMSNSNGDQIRRIILAGQISDMMAAQFLEQLTYFEYTDCGVPINVYINSCGGGVDAALCMVDAMTTCSCPIRTIGMGSVASAAVLLLAAGDRGSRLITENCRVMIHQVSTGLAGNSSELDNEIQEVLRLQEIYNKVLSKCTGKAVSTIKKDIIQNYYMSAAEAIGYGIADKIMPSRKMTKIPLPVVDKKQFRLKKPSSKSKP